MFKTIYKHSNSSSNFYSKWDKYEEKEKNDPEYEERSKKVSEWIHKLYEEEEEKGK